ncbi:histone-lysine N-methyltransferase eggless isoform X1 [Danaus plexippus]|uniref:histone-lysine N-methyltransferase eggless isoform X1 n=1 Tax=Danaus plexippus TaxID=13037 RepID=UPI002AB027C4|nr:histone-lysine N-methyltransferase eggless isoform X1 [Danaus plexippus]
MASKQNMEDEENLVGNKEPDDTMNVNDPKDGEVYESVDDDMELKWEDDDIDDVSITNEDALLEDVAMDNDDKLLPSDSVIPVASQESIAYEINPNEFINKANSDETFEPAKAHGLNKPDMMLEILTHNLSDLSDDEDLTNLKMSPDVDLERCSPNKGSPIENKADFMETDLNDDFDRISSLVHENVDDDLDKGADISMCEDSKPAETSLSRKLSVNDDSIDEDILLADDDKDEQDEGGMEELLDDKIDLDAVDILEINSEEKLELESEKNKLLQNIPDSDGLKLNNEEDVSGIKAECGAECKEVDEIINVPSPKPEISEAHVPKVINADQSNDSPTSEKEVQVLKTGIKRKKLSLRLRLDKTQSTGSDVIMDEHTSLKSDGSEVTLRDPGNDQINSNNAHLTSEDVANQPDIANKDLITAADLESEHTKRKKDSEDTSSQLPDNNVSLKPKKDLKSKEKKLTPDIEPQPSTSGSKNIKINIESASKSDSRLTSNISKLSSPAEDIPGTTDNLDLLAESSRVTHDDEAEDEYMDDEEGEDFEQFDESSNQMAAEQSEDSEQHHSDNAHETTHNNEKEFSFTITDVVTENVVKVEIENQDSIKSENLESVPIGNVCQNMDVSKVGGVETDFGNENKKLTSEEEKNLDYQDETKDCTDVKKSEALSYVELEESSEEGNHELDALDANKTDEVGNTNTTQDINEDEPAKTEDTGLDDSNTLVEDTTNQGTKALDKDDKTKSQGLEVFNLDSDEEDVGEKNKTDISHQETPENPKPQSQWVKCINKSCASTSSDYYKADGITVNFYDPERKKRGYVCQTCLNLVEERNQLLISGIKSLVPLLKLEPGRPEEDLVEISDSESEDEAEPEDDDDVIGAEGARVIEEKLTDVLNETWVKYNLDDRLQEAQDQLKQQLEQLQKDSLEINQLLDECQLSTDKLRSELYSSFERDIKELPSLLIFDVPNCSYTCVDPSGEGSRLLKRRKSSVSESPAKKSALSTGDQDTNTKDMTDEKTEEDNPDVSVVHLSVESAPPDLPPAGEVTYPPLRVGMTIYASKNALGSWMKAKIVEITPKSSLPNCFTLCRVKYEYKQSKPTKILPARCIAYIDPPDVRMTIGTRVIALFKDITMKESFYPGIVAEIPNPVNNYRYLIFFDDGYSQYAPHSKVRLVCECASHVWEEVQPKSREFVRKYLLAYPERPMVRLHPGQSLKTEWKDNWWSSVVVSVDASLVEVQFLQLDRREWIYRGSTRLAPLYLELQAAERHRPRALPRAQTTRTNMPYVEYTRSEEQTNKQAETSPQQQQSEEFRRQRAVAKKSTTETRPPPPTTAQNLDNVTSRVVYYTPKKQVKPYKMVPHTCSPACKRTDVLALKDLRTYNPLAKPLLSGWERQIVLFKGNKVVLYVSPCGRRIRSPRELHRYLRTVGSDLPVDLFDFTPSTHCLAEFVLNKCYVGKKDLSHGKENVPVPCVNYYDESLPEFCSYNTERTPTAGVPLNLDPEFLCGCDCEDDCEDKSKCACWQLTLEGARTIGLEGENVGYVYKRLPEPLPSGIYECNSRCKCRDTCLNRVAQHPLQLKLQVFKTLNRGWGIRALNDIPKGAFLCVYAGNLLTDATANLDGLNEGDEYLAELDYIEVVEQMKEGYEEDIPENIKKMDEAEIAKQQLMPDDEMESSSSEEGSSTKNGEEDDDFSPGYIGLGVTEFNKRLRKRDSKVAKEKSMAKDKDKTEARKENEEDCITISDDEEVREPSNFTAAAGMGANEFKSKYRSVRSLFGEDEACYIMDAKVQGNIGRYLNHSCVPNVFVQNVFVDTHDPRFPWVAFFALRAVRAGGELTWNYNYDVGSVPGKVLYCYCGAPTCRGRLL